MKKCPYCAEEIQDDAVVCRYCGRDLNTKSKKQDTQPEQKRGSMTPAAIALAIIFLCLIAFLLFRRGSDGSGSRTYTPSNIDAIAMCQVFVERQLKAPKTADFASSSNSRVSQNGNTFTVISYVDAENSFGAMIRTDYTCTVKYIGNDEWRLEALETTP